MDSVDQQEMLIPHNNRLVISENGCLPGELYMLPLTCCECKGEHDSDELEQKTLERQVNCFELHAVYVPFFFSSAIQMPDACRPSQRAPQLLHEAFVMITFLSQI